MYESALTDQINQAHQMALFRADLAQSSPESYDVSELLEIARDIITTGSLAEQAMREDFQSHTLEERAALFTALVNAPDSLGFDYWASVLYGDPLPEGSEDVVFGELTLV